MLTNKLGDKLTVIINECKEEFSRQRLKERDEEEQRWIQEQADSDRYFDEIMSIGVDSVIRRLPEVLIAKAKDGKRECRFHLSPYGLITDNCPAILRLKRYCSRNKLTLEIDSCIDGFVDIKPHTTAIISW